MIATTDDLLCLINEIRRSEAHMALNDIKLSRLKYFSNPGISRKRYTTFSIPKKSGGQREISAPVPTLKAILWPMNEILASVYEPRTCVMGFTRNRSVVDNAKAHMGQNYVLNMDLKDFFPSIRRARVWKRLQLPPFNFTQEVASLVAGLCSVRVRTADGKEMDVLPQGAPTSPILTNIICEKLDRNLSAVAARFNLRYTRYADDITFSSMHSALSLDGEAVTEIRRVIEEQGFTINEAKTRLQKRGSRQEVTGIVVSDKVNTPRSYVRDLDQILYVWKKFGYEKAYARLLQERSVLPGKVKGNVSLENVIGGKLDYLRMVKGKKDKVYLRYADKFAALVGRQRAVVGDVMYLVTYEFNEFIKLFNANFNFSMDKEDNPRFSIELFGVPQRVSMNGSKAMLGVLSSKSAKKNLFISMCSKKGNLFWALSTNKPKILSPATFKIPLSEIIDIWEKDGIEAAMAAAEGKKKRSVEELMSIMNGSVVFPRPTLDAESQDIIVDNDETCEDVVGEVANNDM